MTKLTEKTTIYLEPYVKKFLQLYSLQHSKSLSQVVNELFEIQMRRFESTPKSSDGSDHPSIAEWKIVKSEIDKKRK
ncbi:hypothetical protein HYW35_00945 [Candidatus Saccharibacteria bacterium]|nr:hypothetical protein [Candidatus Saccharibacteria bacterium]